MANRYWRGGTGNWSDTSHWSTSSGGSGGASVPGISDNAIFDANSFSANGQYVTMPTDVYSLNSLDMSAVTRTVEMRGPAGMESGYLKVYDTFVLSPSVTITKQSAIFVIDFYGFDLRPNNALIITDLVVIMNSALLGSNARIMSLSVRGSLSTDGHLLTSNSVLVSGSIDISDSTITMAALGSNSGGSWYSVNSTGVVANNSVIVLQGVNSIYGGTAAYNEVRFTGDNWINANLTAAHLYIEPGAKVSVNSSGQSAITTTITDTFTANGTEADPITIRSTVAGKQHVFRKTSGTVDVTYVDLKDSVATGGATFNNYRGINSGNNAGWNFTGPTMPVANFNQSATSGIRTVTINFTDTSTGGVESWLWNFGDGTTSTAPNPSKTYNSPGTYTVSLKVTNEVGENTKTKTSVITVTPYLHTRTASGTLNIGGGTSARKVLAKRSATGGIVIGGSARGIIRSDLDAIDKKKYLVKVYDAAGNYQETWRDVISEPSYSQEINEVGSSMTLELARNSDSLGQTTSPLQTEAGTTITTEAGQPLYATTTSRNQVFGDSTVQHNYRVDVYVYYGEVSPLLTEDGEEITTEDGEALLAQTGAPSGRRIFSGFIAEINVRYGQSETTIVQLMSYGFDLSQFLLDTTEGATTVPFNSYDPSDIVREAMDRFATVSASYGTYTRRGGTSISTTGTMVSYTFKVNTYAEVLQKSLELMPSDWYFYVGLGDNIVYFRERATTPHHTFYLGKHLSSLDLRSYIGESFNDVTFTGGGEPSLYRRYVEAPATGTRRTLYRFSDARVTLPDSAEILSTGLIEEKNKIQFRTTLSIVSQQYDIETINVGDMVGFRNFGNEIDGLLMQVVGLTYTPDIVTLQLDSLPRTVNKRLEDVRRNLTVEQNQDVPATPA